MFENPPFLLFMKVNGDFIQNEHLTFIFRKKDMSYRWWIWLNSPYPRCHFVIRLLHWNNLNSINFHNIGCPSILRADSILTATIATQTHHPPILPHPPPHHHQQVSQVNDFCWLYNFNERAEMKNGERNTYVHIFIQLFIYFFCKIRRDTVDFPFTGCSRKMMVLLICVATHPLYVLLSLLK